MPKFSFTWSINTYHQALKSSEYTFFAFSISNLAPQHFNRLLHRCNCKCQEKTKKSYKKQMRDLKTFEQSASCTNYLHTIKIDEVFLNQQCCDHIEPKWHRRIYFHPLIILELETKNLWCMWLQTEQSIRTWKFTSLDYPRSKRKIQKISIAYLWEDRN